MRSVVEFDKELAAHHTDKSQVKSNDFSRIKENFAQSGDNF